MTDKIQQIRRLRQQAWIRDELARYDLGKLGRVNSDGSVTIEADEPDFVWVTLDKGTLIHAYNKGNGAVDNRAGLRVRVRMDAGRRIIDGLDPNGFSAGDINAPGKVYSVNNVAPDSHGNVTLDSDDITEGSTNLYTTATSVGAAVNAATTDDTIDDTDVVPYTTGSTLKKTAWSVIKSTLKTYFDTLYTFANIVADNAITNAKLRDSGALSVIGRSANSSGDPADISATAASGAVLRESGSTIGFGTVATAGIANSAVTNTKLANMADSTVKGQIVGGSGAPVDLTAAQLTAIIETATLYLLLAGRSGGQTAKGDTASGGNLTLMSTAHATKGKILFGTSGYDEANNRLGILTQSPTKPLQVGAAATDLHSSGTRIALNNDATGAELSIATANATQRSGTSYIRARGDLTTPTTVADGDNLGFTAWKAYDGTNVLAPAVMEGQVDGAVSTGTVPVRVILATGNSNSRTTRQTWFSDGKVAIGAQTSAGAWVDVLQPTLGDPVLRLASTATNDDPTEDYSQARLATTSAATGTLATIPISASNTYMITVDVIARRTGGSAGTADDGKVWHLARGYVTISGTVTTLGITETGNAGTAGAGTWGIALNVSGSNVVLEVTGQTNVNITWHAFIRVKKVGS